jgi:hypothetical protein
MLPILKFQKLGVDGMDIASKINAHDVIQILMIVDQYRSKTTD